MLMMANQNRRVCFKWYHIGQCNAIYCGAFFSLTHADTQMAGSTALDLTLTLTLTLSYCRHVSSTILAHIKKKKLN